MRALPRRTAVVVVASLVGGTLAFAGPLAQPASAAAVQSLNPPAYDEDVYGDFRLVGNGNLRCPTADDGAEAPTQTGVTCDAAATRSSGTGNAGVNDNYDMQWNDTDGAGGNFNTSSATINIPAGATIDFARLSWSGNTGVYPGRATSSCGGTTDAAGAVVADRPVADATTGATASPSTNPVRLTAAGAMTNVAPAPGSYITSSRAAATGVSASAEYYTAWANVTAALQALPTGSNQTVSVANVWSPEGYNCFAGWSLAVVYEYAAPNANAPALNTVQIRNGHVRQFQDEAETSTPITGLRPVTSTSRVGVTAFEGDFNIPGDYLELNQVDQGNATIGPATNFFTSYADTRSAPSLLNNFSTDVKTFTTTAISSGQSTATLDLGTTQDSYLLQQFVISTPRPDIRATKTTPTTQVRPGGPIAFTFTVSNPTPAPLTGVVIVDPAFPACSRPGPVDGTDLGPIAANQSVTFVCNTTAPTTDFANTATIRGTDAFSEGNEVVVSTAPIDVINPAITLTKTANASSYDAGQAITFTTAIRNTGDTPLTNIVLTDPASPSCQRTVASLVAGATSAATCTATAPFAGGSNTASVTGIDPTNTPVSATATAAVPTNGSISGRVFADVANDGAVQAGDTGIAGVPLTLSGTTSEGAVITPRTATTGTDGSWTFPSVPPGSYVVTETQPAAAAYNDGTDTPGSNASAGPTNDTVRVTLADQGTSTGNLFAEVPQGSMAGSVYEDADADGTRSGGENGIAAVTMVLTGTDDGGNPVSRTTTTGPDGSYSFGAVRAGTYTVNQPGQPAGFVDGREAIGTIGGTGAGALSPPDAIATIPLPAGGAGTGYTFGEVRVSTLTGNVQRDGIASPTPITVTLTGTDDLGNPVTRTTQSGAGGAFVFDTLRPGTYTVTETQPAAYGAGTAAAGSAGGAVNGSDQVTGIVLGSGINASGYVFNDTSATLSGTLYDDLDRDGTRDGGEPGFGSGATVTLTGPLSGPRTTGTGPDGTYSFAGLPASSTGYTVTFAPPAGSSATSDNPLTVVVAPGTTVAGNDLGLRRERPPVAGPDAAAAEFERPVAISVLGNDADPDGDALTISALTQPASGTVSSSAGVLTYTPSDDFSGLDAFTYTISDGRGGSASATVTVTVALRPNRGPDAVDDSRSTLVDIPVGIQVLYNDTDPDGNPLDVTASTDGANGTVSDTDGVLTYTPVPGFVGTDTFTYTVSDGQGGSDIATVTVTIRPPGTVSGTVFADVNGDGVLDAPDGGIAGVTVTLAGQPDQPGSAVISRTTTTDVNGTWSITSVPAGTYTVTETQPGGFLTSVNTAGSSAVAGPTPDSVTVTLPDAGASTDTLFGERPQASLAGAVYDDLNANGTRQADEPGLSNVTLTLTGTDEAGRAVTRTAVTATDGSYAFLDLRAGTYVVTETQPAGYLDRSETAGAAGGTVTAPDSTTAISLGRTTAATGYLFGDVRAASVSGTVTRDGAASPTPVTLTLAGTDDLGNAVPARTTTSGVEGVFAFTGLRPGSYTLAETQPAGVGTGTATLGSVGGVLVDANRITDIQLGSGTAAIGYVFDDTTGSLSGTVFDDLDRSGTRGSTEPGSGAGITVALTGPAGAIATTTTGAGGSYSFTGLVAATYTVTVTPPPATGLTTPGSRTLAAPAGSSLTDVDFGLRRENAPTAVDDLGTTPFDTPISLPVVGNDLDPDGDTLTVDSFTQAANGSVAVVGGELVYTPATGFSGLDTFTYVATDGRGGSDTATVTVTVRAPGTISGTVFSDDDGDGDVDAGDTGIAGVLLTLTGQPNGGATITRTTTSAGDGTWAFTGIPAGSYVVTETQPVGYVTSANTPGTGGATLSGADGVAATLGDGGLSLGTLFGEQPQASLAGAVYDDLNADGVRDSAEPGLTAVIVTLTGTDEDGNAVVRTTTTGTDGAYAFLALRAGTYAVTEAQPVGLLDGQDLAGTTGGTLSGPDSITAIPLGRTTAGTGYLFGELRAASISGTATVDGTPNSAPVLLTLTGSDDLGAQVTRTTTAGSGGAYAFTGLRPGTYTVTQTQPADLGPGAATAGTAGGTVASSERITDIVVGSGEAATGYAFDDTTASLSGRVYEDLDRDGTRDVGDPGFGPGPLTITVSGPGGLTLTTTTAPDGTYAVDGLPAGSYAVTVAAPAGTSLTSARTLTVVVPATGNAPDNDFGLRRQRPPVATPDDVTTPFETPILLPVLGNDTDPDSDTFAVSAFDATSVRDGTVSNSGGVLTYTPATGFAGVDTFTYTITDSQDLSATTTVTVTVSAQPLPPAFTTAPGNTTQTVPVGSTVTALEATDPENGPLSYAVTVGAPPPGVILRPDGTFDGAPTARGTFAATITVTDAQGLTDVTQLQVVVPNRPPVFDPTNPANDVQTVPRGTTPAPLDAVDPDGDPLTYAVTAGSLPPGVTLTPDGTFEGAPTTLGGSTVTVTVSDGRGGSATTVLEIRVANEAPSYTSDATNTEQTVPVATTPAPLTATDPEDQPLTYGPVAPGTLPPGVTLEPNGTFSGAPTTPGTYRVTIPVTDLGGLSDTTVLVIVVPNRAPVFDPTEPRNDAQTVPLGSTPQLLVAADPDGDPLTFTAAPGTLPDGVTLSPDGTFSGTPTIPGSYSVPVTVSDGNGGTDLTRLEITVPAPANQPPAFTAAASNTTQRVALGGLVTELVATDPENQPLTYAVTRGNLPVGVTLNSNGSFQGAPTTPGTFTVEVTATDAGGLTAETTLTLTVPTPPNSAPVFTNAPTNLAQTVRLGTPAAPLAATDADGDALTYVVTAGDLPAEVSLTPSGTFTGTPGQAGTFTVTVTVSDGRGGSDTTHLVLTVPAPPTNLPPAFTAAPANTAQTVPLAGLLTGLAALDPEGQPLRYSFTGGGLPPGVTLSPDGNFAGAPTTPGTYEAVITVTDPQGGSDVTRLVLTVPAPLVFAPPIFTTATTNDAQTVPVGTRPAPLAASDPDTPATDLVFTLAGGTLPPGVTLLPDGALTGAPTVPAIYTAILTVTDPQGGSDTTTLVITVPAPPVNAAPAFSPAVTNDAQSVAVGGPVSPLVAADPDDAVGSLTYTQIDGDLPDGVTLNPNGTFDGNPTRPGTFTSIVVVSDPAGATDETTLVITVPAPPNTPPVAVDDTRTTTTGTPVTIAVAGNDTDVDADPLTVPSYTQPAAGGTVTQPTAGDALVLTPATGFAGTLTFTYVVADGNGGSDQGAVTVTVVPTPVTNLPPAYTAAPSNTNQQVPLGGSVTDLAATDPENQPLTFTQTGGALPTGVTLDQDGSLDGTPTVPGTYTVEVLVNDPAGLGATTTLVIVVPAPPVNDPPNAVDDMRGTPFGTAVSVPVLGNDRDPESDPLTVIGVTQPAQGTASLNPDGTVAFVPVAGFSGTTTFTYTVSDGNGNSDTATVTVVVAAAPPANEAPVAADDAAVATQDVGTAVAVLTNDTDADGDTLTVITSAQPANGAVSCTLAGVCTYVPDPGFSGTDTFSYTVADGSGGSDTATVTVVVSATPPPVNGAPVAVADSATTPASTPVRIPVLGNDSDPDDDVLTIVSLTQGANGVVSLNPADGSVGYVPDPGFNGVDTFTYTLTDNNGATSTARVSVTVTAAAVNTPPVGVDDARSTPIDTAVTVRVLENDRDPDGDTLTISAYTQPDNGSVSVLDGAFTYVPDAEHSGLDTFTYTITDGNGGFDQVAVTITVIPAANQPPGTQPDAVTTPSGTEVVIPVTDNDVDPDGDELTVISVTQPSNGTVTFADGVVTYLPNRGFTGTDTFTYTVSDGKGGQRSETVTVTVEGDGAGGDTGGENPGGTGGGSNSGGGSGGNGSRIPFTGSESEVLLGWALLLLVAGAGLIAVGAHRRRT